MLLLLPPSETKRDGGDAERVLDLAALSYPSLSRARRAAVSAVRSASRTLAGAQHALRLGPTQRFEIGRNRAMLTAPVMPALSRYTGVLYDALDADSLDDRALELASRTVVVHSALFGLVGAADLIPAYRTSHDARLPGLRLGPHWRDVITAELDAHDGLLLDLRSESYVAMGPVPAGPERYYLRVVAAAPDGQKRALNHFNKKGKGAFVRAVLQSGIDHPDVRSLLQWADGCGIPLSIAAPGVLELVVDQTR
ncbi:YaaA family protein [Marisediminicola senii]|uniref:YaaA family protein n=1 Tax=Marisediminicola senii TaxID=2711233 RepID=UPI0013EB5810|nr:peroxide stress protein YaaA [Marisediminicola senii]